MSDRAASPLFEPQRVQLHGPRHDTEHLAREQARELLAGRRRIGRQPEQLRFRFGVGDVRRERLHLPLAGAGGWAQQLDVDRRAADARLSEEGEIGSDGARVREVEHEALDAIRVASQEDLAVRRRFEAADHARPLRRPGDPQRARDLEAAVVVVDANPFRRRQRQVETQRERKPGERAAVARPRCASPSSSRLVRTIGSR